MYIEKRYLALYQIIEDTVYVEYIFDCRQDYDWLIHSLLRFFYSKRNRSKRCRQRSLERFCFLPIFRFRKKNRNAQSAVFILRQNAPVHPLD